MVCVCIERSLLVVKLKSTERVTVFKLLNETILTISLCMDTIGLTSWEVEAAEKC